MCWKKKDDISDMGLGDDDNRACGDNFNTQTPGTPPSQFPNQPGSSDPGFGAGNLGQQPSPQSFQQPAAPQSFQQPQPFSPPQQQPNYDVQEEVTSKNLEVISSKLDTLRASLDSINQRLENIEAIARGDEEQTRRKRYY